MAERGGLFTQDGVEYDPESGVLWHKGTFDLKIGALIEPIRSRRLDPVRQPIKTMGHPLRSFADLAVLTRAWRKPIYKNIWYLYVKDGLIVGHERARRRAPANALSPAADHGEALKHINERIAELGADSFFMVHNRYYVYSTPSAVARKLAAVLAEAPGLKGHIVLNPYSFGLITVKGVGILRVLPDIDPPCDDPVTGARLSISDALTYPILTINHWAKALTRRKKPVIIQIREETVLRQLQEICLDKIDTWNRLVNMTAKGDDPAFERPSVEEAGPLLIHGGFHHL